MFRFLNVIAGLFEFRGRFPALVNFIGLIVAFGAVGLCILTVRSELSYDSWIRDNDKAFRLHLSISPTGSTPIILQAVNAHFAEALSTTPQIRKATRLSKEPISFRLDGRSFNEIAQIVDGNFLEAFDIPLTANSLTAPLSRPGQIVLSKKAAQKYFGDADPIGKTLSLANGAPLEITGVLATLPGNTHLVLDMLISSSTPATRLYEQSKLSRPNEQIAYTYFWLADGETKDSIAAILPDLLVRSPAFALDEAAALKPALEMVPVTGIHLSGLGELKPGGSRMLLNILAAIGLIVVVITSVNFSIFAISRTTGRMLEYGVRRSFGASRLQIVLPVLAEAVTTTVLAMAIAGVAIMACSPLISHGFDSVYSVTLRDGLLLLIPPAIVTIAASCSASFLSGGIAWMSPAAALRRQKGHSGNIAWGAVITLQFWLTSIILVLMIVIASQTNFAIRQSLPAGSGSDIFIIDGGTTPPEASIMQTARVEIGRIPSVHTVALSEIVPTNFSTSITGFRNQEKGQAVSVSLRLNRVDGAFFSTYDLLPLAGRVFTAGDEAQPDRRVLVLGQAALPLLGFGGANEAVGARVITGGPQGESYSYEVLAVVPDITMKSVEHPVEPMVFIPASISGRFLSIKVEDQNRRSVIEYIGRVWKKITGQEVMNGQFLDERLQKLYRPLEQTRKLFLVMGFVATTIAFLGIYALSSLLSIRQQHEIGLRRAFGASRLNIIGYVTGRFLMPVFIGSGLAVPLAAVISLHWLGSYSSRIELTAWPFILTGTVVLGAGLLGVVQHVAHLARVKPAEALKE